MGEVGHGYRSRHWATQNYIFYSVGLVAVPRSIKEPKRANLFSFQSAFEVALASSAVDGLVLAPGIIGGCGTAAAATAAAATAPFAVEGRIATLSSCQVARLPDCQVAKLPSCQVAKSPSCQVAVLPSCRNAKLPCCQVLDLRIYRIVKLPICRVADLPSCQFAVLSSCWFSFVFYGDQGAWEFQWRPRLSFLTFTLVHTRPHHTTLYPGPVA